MLNTTAVGRITGSLETDRLSDTRKLTQFTYSGCGLRKRSSSYCKPMPSDFDYFLPWVCLVFQVPESVVVIRINQAKRSSAKRASSAKLKSLKLLKTIQDDLESFKIGPSSTSLSASLSTRVSSAYNENVLPVYAYYDSDGYLAEIAVVSCTTSVHRNIFKAISLCVPYHSHLTKLTIRRGGLTGGLLHEIGILLPFSNLTDVCLDDNFVPEGNYYILLDQASNLKHLSLSRCSINDDVCTNIACRIDYGMPGEKSLAILDMSSNLITDIGAEAIGQVLRKNRHLLHVNLSGNKITDHGMGFILRHLMEFPLTFDEVMERKYKLSEYYKKKINAYKVCLEEITGREKTTFIENLPDAYSRTRDNIKSFGQQIKLKRNRKSVVSVVLDEITPKETAKRMTKDFGGDNNFSSGANSFGLQNRSDRSKKSIMSFAREISFSKERAEKMAKEIVGDFYHPFEEENIILRKGSFYYAGNFKLCSINIAYNNVGYQSLIKILEVLKYQSLLPFKKKTGNTGLMRIILDGNYMPQSCTVLDNIDKYLKKVITDHAPVSPRSASNKGRSSGAFAKSKTKKVDVSQGKQTL